MDFDAKNFDWGSRRIWHAAGYFASVGWMIYVLAETGGRIEEPLFDTLFIVPIGIWTAGIAVAWLLRRRARRRE